jgi:hypothetical protein
MDLYAFGDIPLLPFAMFAPTAMSAYKPYLKQMVGAHRGGAPWPCAAAHGEGERR